MDVWFIAIIVEVSSSAYRPPGSVMVAFRPNLLSKNVCLRCLPFVTKGPQVHTRPLYVPIMRIKERQRCPDLPGGIYLWETHISVVANLE